MPLMVSWILTSSSQNAPSRRRVVTRNWHVQYTWRVCDITNVPPSPVCSVNPRYFTPNNQYSLRCTECHSDAGRSSIMPIEALPVSTSRVIGSTLVLSDAKSVVKELIDNALDARATTINIDISQNTLDVIQVKDNGTGIGVQDRQLLCKRGCTSKIRSLEDLGRLGGSFLGFRGEALASIAELSRAAIITTRVDGEIVGSSLTFGPSGMLR